MAKKVDITYRTIIFVAAFGFAVWFVYQIRDIIFNLFLAFILMAALSPLVEKLAKRKVPRILTVILIYVLFFAFVSLVAAGVVPPLVEQTADLVGRIPDYLEQINLPWLDESLIASQFSELGNLPSHILRLSVGVFVNLIKVTVILVLTMYMILERRNLRGYLSRLFSDGRREKVIELVERIEINLGLWVRVELFLMALIGTMSYFGLRLLGIEFCLPLAVLAGLLEIVPNVGPTLAAVPAIVAGLTISPTKGLVVALLYVIIQQIENDFVVPKVMQKGLQFSPLIVLVALAIGLNLGGVAGMVLSLPILIVLREVFRETLESNKSLSL